MTEKKIKRIWPYYPRTSALIRGKRKYAPHFFRWRAMISRCYHKKHPEFKRYGARGIEVCGKWQYFWNYFVWVEKTFEPGKTVDRRDNDRSYSEENCRWATYSEQQLNSRITPNRLRAIRTAQLARKKANYSDLKKRTRLSNGRFA